MPKDKLYDWSIQQREVMRLDLDGYKSGLWKIGEIVDGKTVDQTDEEIADLERRIQTLDGIIAAYEKEET